MQSIGNRNFLTVGHSINANKNLILIKRMRVGWLKCGSDPRDEGHLACL